MTVMILVGVRVEHIGASSSMTEVRFLSFILIQWKMNHEHAFKLYDSVKEFMGKAPVSSTLQHSSLKGKNKKRDVVKLATKSECAADEPAFKECSAPQQTNGFDCGMWVMAIAKAICECYSRKIGSNADWLFAVQRRVDTSVEMSFRNEVMELIEDLRKN